MEVPFQRRGYLLEQSIDDPGGTRCVLNQCDCGSSSPDIHLENACRIFAIPGPFVFSWMSVLRKVGEDFLTHHCPFLSFALPEYTCRRNTLDTPEIHNLSTTEGSGDILQTLKFRWRQNCELVSAERM